MRELKNCGFSFRHNRIIYQGEMKHVCIIGGGISGLSAAWYLQRLAPQCKSTLIEAADRLGGKIMTERTNGVVVEAGPESMLVQKPAALDLCAELGLSHQVIPMESRKLYVLHSGQFIPMPEGFKLIIPTDTEALMSSSLFSEKGKRQILAEEDTPPRIDDRDESLASFVRRRFGLECLERVGGPLMGGIYVADPEKLSMKTAFPQLLALEKKYGSLIKAFRNSESVTKAAPPSNFAEDTLVKGIKTRNPKFPLRQIRCVR